jgi:LPS export ABC transporter protein LptC
MLVAALLLAACGDDSSGSTEALAPGDLPPGEMTFGLHHVMTKQGVRSAILDADTAFQQDEGRHFDLRGVHLQFFTATGAESRTLTSRSGEYNPNEGSFVARDSVVLITQSEKGSRQLETEELFYDTRTEEIWSDSAFVLTQGGNVSRGTSFRSDVYGNNWTASNLVTDEVATGNEGVTF